MGQLQVIEESGQRVLTTAQLAEAYGTEVQIIVNNFNRNKDRYKLGKHFNLLTGDELKDFRAKNQIDLSLNTNKLYLWTEKGAWLHAKSLNTDQAWEAYEMLVDDYYRKVEQLNSLLGVYLNMSDEDKAIAYFTEIKEKKAMEKQLLIATEKANKYEQFLDSEGYMQGDQLSKILGTGRTRLYKFLREQGVYMSNNTPYQKYMNRGLFKVVNKVNKYNTVLVTLITTKGADYIANLFNKESKAS
jgi:phage antirepressor YoqD-like protein